ncbi:zinc finger protein 706-like [Pteronotus mesoamericanus]|uniref:zinc finger protein 706-like n=1 Tax=Pteronotus mesoamericanus TaxID=1884717 RepID=UPI0023EC15CB|nr:zinc finger protein 706-like [Pteronotus parnellii mesoamericanus]
MSGEGQSSAGLTPLFSSSGHFFWPLRAARSLQRKTCPGPNTARRQQKIQSRQKNAKKQAGQKKKQGHNQKVAVKAADIYICTVRRTQMPDLKTFKQPFESKHPKTPLPPELADL